MASKLNFNKTIFAVITGASQGIGRTIAIEIAKHLKPSSKIVLLARSESGLSETQNLINDINKNIEIEVHAVDLSKLEYKDYEDLLKRQMENVKCEVGLIVHNAGQVGELNKCVTLNDIALWNDYFNLNLFSVAALNAAFFKVFEKMETIYVINITSLCGRMPFKNMSLYGSGKAARELFFKVLAEEEQKAIVLNYSPGPVKTAMHTDIITNAKDEELKNMFLKMENVLTCQQTVNKLMGIIKEGNFKSGDTIDYFD